MSVRVETWTPECSSDYIKFEQKRQAFFKTFP
jgi:hypothetical protein